MFRTFHWTANVFACGATAGTAIVLLRNIAQFPFIGERRVRHSELLDMPDDNLLKIFEDELFRISSKRQYPLDVPPFKIMVTDDLESRTDGGFQFTYSALFFLSVRLALKDTQEIRREFPNFFKLFKENNLDKNELATENIADSDLEKVLLTKNAKKFAVAREILYADSFELFSLALIPPVSFTISGVICYLLRKKIGTWPSFTIGLFVAAILNTLLLKSYYIHLTLSLDRKAAVIDEDHMHGCIDYLNNSIELCKLLYKLTHGVSTAFDEEGNYLAHALTYRQRLDHAELLAKNYYSSK